MKKNGFYLKEKKSLKHVRLPHVCYDDALYYILNEKKRCVST